MKNKFLPFLVLTVLSIPAVYYLIIPGFYEPSDLHHLADIYQMVRALASGQIPPRLGPDFTFSYGYPLFNFYYVLPFYLGAFWFFLFGSLTASFKFVFIFGSLLSIVGMYLFLKEFFGKYASLAGAVLYLYTPYKAVQVYVRGSMGEVLGIAFLPLILWGILGVVKNPSYRKFSLLGLITAMFILSHNYFWLLSGFWILAFSVILIFLSKERIRAATGLFFSALIGIGISFYWWFPAFTEYRFVSSTTPFRLEDHFPFLKQLVFPSWGYGASVWGPGDEMSFQIGLVNIAAILLLGFILARKWRRLDKTVLYLGLFTLSGFIITVFFMNIRSLALWRLLPIYQFVQFPWRLLFLTSFFTSFALGIVIEYSPKKWVRNTSIISVLLILFINLGYFRPSKIVFKSDDEYLNRMFADRTTEGEKKSVSEEYLNWSEDYLLLPKWTERRPGELPQDKIEANENIEVENIRELTPIRWSADVNANESGIITFHSYYFPGWFAEIDGKPTNVRPGQPSGQIVVEIPKGKHSIEFYWKETPKRKWSDIISFVFLISTISLSMRKDKKIVKGN